MTRFLLPAVILFAGLSFSNTSVIGQQKPSSSSKTTEKSNVKNKPTEDELLRDLLFCECLKTIHAGATPKMGVIQLTPAITVYDWVQKWVQQGSDANHAHDPVTGQNYNWDSDKKAWIDSKTGECICPKCESAKENTEEPKKETKEKKTAMKEKTSSNNLFAGNQGNFEVCAGVGYGFSFNGSLLGQNKTFTVNDRTFDGVYGSWAQGENFFIKTDFKFSNCFGAGVAFDYTYGKNIDYSTNTIGNNPTTINYEGRYTGYSATPFIQFNPCGINRLAPYIDLGMRLNFSNDIKQNIVQTQTNNNVTTVTKQGATFKGAFTTGFDASLGVKYALSKHWALMGELNFSNSNFIASTGTINSYTVNGADQLGTLNTSQKQFEYVKSYTVPNSGPDPNSPSKALRSSQSSSIIGVRIGLHYQMLSYQPHGILK